MIGTMTRTATSERVTSKAERLAETVEYLGRGMFSVRGENDRYVVKAPYGERDSELWACDCPWGRNGGTSCAHVRAAAIWLDRVMALR